MLLDLAGSGNGEVLQIQIVQRQNVAESVRFPKPRHGRLLDYLLHHGALSVLNASSNDGDRYLASYWITNANNLRLRSKLAHGKDSGKFKTSNEP